MSTQSDPTLDSAHEWLSRVSTELGQDPAVVRDLVGELLDLTRDVAHGPSKPAAPVTAFLVGLAAGRELSPDAGAAESTAAVRERITLITELLTDRTDG